MSQKHVGRNAREGPNPSPGTENMAEDQFDAISDLIRLNLYDPSTGGEVVHSSDTSPAPKFKARSGWFAAIIIDMHLAVENGQITDSELIAKINDFSLHYTSSEFVNRPRTLPTDIDAATKLIDEITGTTC